jgi:hypothetical protein
VSGSGTASSDSILARVSNGEYILNANAAGKLGSGVLNHINRTGSLPKFADGGRVGQGQNQQMPKIDLSGLTGVLNSFNQAISQFSEQLANIPLKIQMTGTHEVNVNLNGAELLKSAIGSFIEQKIAEGLSKHVTKGMDPQDKIEKGY